MNKTSCSSHKLRVSQTIKYATTVFFFHQSAQLSDLSIFQSELLPLPLPPPPTPPTKKKKVSDKQGNCNAKNSIKKNSIKVFIWTDSYRQIILQSSRAYTAVRIIKETLFSNSVSTYYYKYQYVCRNIIMQCFFSFFKRVLHVGCSTMMKYLQG